MSPLDVLRRLALVGRVLEEEGRLHLPLPARVGRKAKPRPPRGRRRARAARRSSPRSPSASSLGPRPLLAADRWTRGGAASSVVGDPALDQVDPVDRNAQQLAAGVLDHQRLEDLLADAAPAPSRGTADAVVHVDHVLARLQRGEALDRGAAAELAAAAQPPGAPEDLVVGEDAQRRDGARPRTNPPERADRERDPAAAPAARTAAPGGARAAPRCRRGSACARRARGLAQQRAEPPHVPVDRLRRRRASGSASGPAPCSSSSRGLAATRAATSSRGR
jgi:hypothetical protein